MSVKILYFAGLKEKLGVPGESIDLPAGICTVGGLRDWLTGDAHHQIQPVPIPALATNPGTAPALVIEPEPVFATTGRASPMMSCGRYFDT